jgi:hypothetical protein
MHVASSGRGTGIAEACRSPRALNGSEDAMPHQQTNAGPAGTVLRRALGLGVLAAAALALGTCSRPDGKAGYPVFSRAPSFEPSGVAETGVAGRFVVVSDNEEALSVTLYRLSRPDDGQPRLVELSAFAVDAVKLEAVTASRKSPGVLYLATSFDRPAEKSNRVIRVSIDEKGKASGEEVIALQRPAKVIKSSLAHAWSKVEALALTADEKHMLVGVRAVGESYKKPQYRVVILRYSMADLAADPEVVVDVDVSGPDLVGRAEGISGLEYAAPLKSYLMLTSYEDDKLEPPTAQVGGHLWVLPKDFSAGATKSEFARLPRVALQHKPEGVTIAGPDGKQALVVFDDDDDRRSPTGEGGMFKLAPNEAAFRLVDIPTNR